MHTFSQQVSSINAMPKKELDNLINNFRSSHRRCSVKKTALKIFVILTGKHLRLRRSLFLIKLLGLKIY